MIGRISDVCKSIYSGGTPNKKHDEYYYDGNIPWLNTSEIRFNRIYATEKFITDAGLLASSAKWVPADAVIVAMYGATAARTAITKIPLTTNQACCNLIVDVTKADYRYVYYWLCFKYFELASLANGGAQQNLNAGQIKEFPIIIPQIDIQKKIAEMLSVLDDKIENNNRINDNLQQQADALYQAYFSPKSGTQGETVTLDQYCTIFTGKKNANASVDGGKYKFFTCAPESLQIDSYIYDGNAIIVSGNGAYTGRTRFYSGRFDLYQRTYACTLHESVDPDYIFPLYWFVKLELSKKIMGGTRGSAIPYIVMNDLAKFEFIYNEESFAAYMPVFKALTETIQANEFESEQLSELRDSLLPKLMSGEIDVSDIDI